MTNEYELADNRRDKLIFTKEQLLAPLQEGMVSPPHAMAEQMEERDYYLGTVTSARAALRVEVAARQAQAAADEADADMISEGGAA